MKDVRGQKADVLDPKSDAGGQRTKEVRPDRPKVADQSVI
jgi:hypothetical protein